MFLWVWSCHCWADSDDSGSFAAVSVTDCSCALARGQWSILTPVLLLQHALFLAAKDIVVAGMTWKSHQQERWIWFLLIRWEKQSSPPPSSCGKSRLERTKGEIWQYPLILCTLGCPFQTQRLKWGRAGAFQDNSFKLFHLHSYFTFIFRETWILNGLEWVTYSLFWKECFWKNCLHHPNFPFFLFSSFFKLL